MSFLRRTLERALAAVPVAVLAVLWAGCAGDYPQTTFRPVTDFGARINELFYGIVMWTMLVLAVVVGVLTFILIRFRSRPGVEAKKIYGNNLAEILWTLGPAIIVVMILVPTVQTIFESYKDAPDDALVVEAIGHQWWWEFRYPELGVTTANELYLPVGRHVDLRLSSADVVHNFWVPRLAGKRYNYPVPARRDGAPEPKNFNRLGFVVEEAGEYLGQCAEFCGESHAIMRMRVIARPADEFEAWVESMKAPVAAIPEPETLEEQGYNAFMRYGCIACHSIAGTPARGILGPDLTDVGSRWTIGAGLFENTPENMAKWIKDSPAYKPGSKMTPFPQITDQDMEALVAYLQSLK